MARPQIRAVVRWAQGAITNDTFFLSGATTAYDDIGGDVLGVRINRGRTDPHQPMNAGRCVLTLNDQDGKYVAGYASSPLVGAASDGLGYLLPYRTLRVQVYNPDDGSTTTRFYGFITRIVADPDRKTATIEAADALYLLTKPSTAALTVSTPGTAAFAIISLINDRFTGLATGSPSLVLVASSTYNTFAASVSIAAGQPIQNVINDLMAAEQGIVFVRKDGALVFLPRHWQDQPPNNAAQSTLTNVQVRQLGTGVDVESIRNRATVQRTGGVAQTATDTASIAAYDMADWGTLTTPYLDTDAEALNTASWIVATRKDPKPIGYAADLDADAGSAVQAAMIARDLQDRVNIDAIRVGAADYFIVGIEEQMDDSRRYTMRWLLQRRRAADVGAIVGYSRVGYAAVGYAV